MATAQRSGPARSSLRRASSSASTARATRAPRASTPGRRSTAQEHPSASSTISLWPWQRILKLKKIPVVLGGEHTVTWGVIKGYLDAGVKDFGVVQIDAHADLRDAYEGDKYSHASVMRRVVEAGIPLVQLGARFLRGKNVRRARRTKSLPLTPLILPLVAQARSNLPKNFPPTSSSRSMSMASTLRCCRPPARRSPAG